MKNINIVGRNHIFEQFDKVVEERIRNSTPKIVYKFRSDWKKLIHKKIITDRKIWFAAPRDLNDPYDIRTRIKFDVSEIDHPLFLQKMKMAVASQHRNRIITESQIASIAENKVDEIKINPQAYFENEYRKIRESEIFDRIGLFSCSKDALSDSLWAHYGNDHSGFAVGFNTVELCKNIVCSIGNVDYNDEIPLFSFLNLKDEGDFNPYFLKSTKWTHEQEFRFIIMGEDENLNREIEYPKACVSEVVLGAKFPKKLKANFVGEVHSQFSQQVAIYQIVESVSGLVKIGVT